MPDEISAHYTLHVKTMTPLHIGSGRRLLRDYDYAVRQGRTWRIDEDALLDAALSGGQFDAALLRRPAAELLQPEDWQPDSPLFRYVIPGTPRSQKKGARLQELQEQIKDAFDRPYLPGSSLKGAFRTALLDWALAQDPRALDTRRLKDSPRWATQPIERALLGRDPNHDLLRALHVADSDALPPAESLFVVNAQVVTSRQAGSPIEVEALRPRTQFRVPLKLDRFLFTPQANRQLGLGQRQDWLADLMHICRERALVLLAAERDWFAQHQPQAPISGFYGRLYDQLRQAPDQRCLLQVGWGGGWQTKTVGRRLNDRQREEVIRRYRLARGRRQPGDPFPRSRRVVLNEQSQPVAPLGWVLIDLKPEGES